MYGVDDRVEFLAGDSLEFLRRGDLRGDVLFLSPPWGGPDYLLAEVFDLTMPVVRREEKKRTHRVSPRSPCPLEPMATDAWESVSYDILSASSCSPNRTQRASVFPSQTSTPHCARSCATYPPPAPLRPTLSAVQVSGHSCADLIRLGMASFRGVIVFLPRNIHPDQARSPFPRASC